MNRKRQAWQVYWMHCEHLNSVTSEFAPRTHCLNASSLPKTECVSKCHRLDNACTMNPPHSATGAGGSECEATRGSAKNGPRRITALWTNNSSPIILADRDVSRPFGRTTHRRLFSRLKPRMFVKYTKVSGVGGGVASCVSIFDAYTENMVGRPFEMATPTRPFNL